MKTLFLTIVLLFSTIINAQGFGNQGSCRTCVTVAGRIIDLSNTNIKVLYAKMNTSGFDVGKHIVGSTITDYVVPASTKAVVLGFTGLQISGTLGEIGNILYSDNARTNISTASINPVYCDTGNTTALAGDIASVSLNVPFSGDCLLVAPAGKFIHMEHLNGAGKLNMKIYIGECPDTGACEFHN